MNKRLALSSLLSLFSGTVVPLALQAEEVWRIPFSAFKCIQENVDSYFTTSSEPIIIVVAACPIANVANALSSTAQNTGLFNILEGNSGDSVIILTREELRCLVATTPEEDQFALVSIPKDNACDPS